MLHETETRVVQESLYIFEGTGVIIVQADDVMAVCNQSVAKVGAYKTRTTCYKDIHAADSLPPVEEKGKQKG